MPVASLLHTSLYHCLSLLVLPHMHVTFHNTAVHIMLLCAEERWCVARGTGKVSSCRSWTRTCAAHTRRPATPKGWHHSTILAGCSSCNFLGQCSPHTVIEISPVTNKKHTCEVLSVEGIHKAILSIMHYPMEPRSSLPTFCCPQDIPKPDVLIVPCQFEAVV